MLLLPEGCVESMQVCTRRELLGVLFMFFLVSLYPVARRLDIRPFVPRLPVELLVTLLLWIQAAGCGFVLHRLWNGMDSATCPHIFAMKVCFVLDILVHIWHFGVDKIPGWKPNNLILIYVFFFVLFHVTDPVKSVFFFLQSCVDSVWSWLRETTFFFMELCIPTLADKFVIE